MQISNQLSTLTTRPQAAASAQSESPAAQPQDHFSSLPPAQQDQFRAKLDVLSQKGRLFRQNEPGGPLLKAQPSDVYNSLERKVGLTWVVDRGGVKEESSQTTSQSWGWQSYENSGSTTKAYETSNYCGSPLFGWQDLSFVSTDPAGLPGVTSLPKPEGQALTGLYEHDQSKFWQATGWIMDVPTSEVSITDWVSGSKETTKKWNQ